MNEKKKSTVFVSTIFPGDEEEFNSFLLVESIRRNGGKLADSPIWLFYPENFGEFSPTILDHLKVLDITLIPFSFYPDRPRIFFFTQISVLVNAEKSAKNQCDSLVWMDTNSIVLNEPEHFILPENKYLGYKPVHHLLLGSKFNEPLNPFWSEIYKLCEVNPNKAFPMQPMIEDISMRPYINAGFLVASPNNALFSTWMVIFKKSLSNPIIKDHISKDNKYAIFLHQAILSGVILMKFEPSQLVELPDTYNYPLHLWMEDHSKKRPISLESFKTIRHEGLLDSESWMTGDPFNKGQTEWIRDTISYYLNSK